MIEIIVKGKKNRGKSIIMMLLYHTFRRLGFEVMTENVDFRLSRNFIGNYINNIMKVPLNRKKVKISLKRIEVDEKNGI